MCWRELLLLEYDTLGNKFLFWQKNPERETEIQLLKEEILEFFKSKNMNKPLNTEEYQELAIIIQKSQQRVQQSHKKSLAGSWGFDFIISVNSINTDRDNEQS